MGVTRAGSAIGFIGGSPRKMGGRAVFAYADFSSIFEKITVQLEFIVEYLMTTD